jgi:hypothetical protein
MPAHAPTARSHRIPCHAVWHQVIAVRLPLSLHAATALAAMLWSSACCQEPCAAPPPATSSAGHCPVALSPRTAAHHHCASALPLPLQEPPQCHGQGDWRQVLGSVTASSLLVRVCTPSRLGHSLPFSVPRQRALACPCAPRGHNASPPPCPACLANDVRTKHHLACPSYGTQSRCYLAAPLSARAHPAPLRQALPLLACAPSHLATPQLRVSLMWCASIKGVLRIALCPHQRRPVRSGEVAATTPIFLHSGCRGQLGSPLFPRIMQVPEHRQSSELLPDPSGSHLRCR